MHLSALSPRFQRFLGGSVAALLTANAFAFATLVSDDATDDGRFRDVEAAGIPEIPESAPIELALITTPDGRTFMADPSTPEGRRAIAEAQRQGATVREVTVPAPGTGDDGDDTPATGGKQPALPGLLGDLGLVVGGDGSGGGGSGGGGTGGLVEIDPGLVGDLLDDPVGTLTGIIRTTPSTLTSVVGNLGSTVSTLVPTVSSVVGNVGTTASSVVGNVGSTVSSLVGGLTPTTAAPPASTPTTTPSLIGGLLGGVGTVVSTVVQAVTPTTAPPPPSTPPTTNPVCTLLVFC